MTHPELDDRGVILPCPTCGQKNRVAFEKLGRTVACGKCGTALASTGAPVEVPSSQDFDRLIAHAAVPVVVDFWAPWCGPCRMVAPELVKVAGRSNGRFLIAKVNTDALGDLGERFRIRSIPTMAVFKHGQEALRTSGARPAGDIEAFVAQAL